jgi:thioredoxin reductase (NADPH)
MSGNVFTSATGDASVLSRAMRERDLLVVLLCAEWCGTCRDFHAVFDRLAQARPAVTFVWLDIEDDSELVGDIDVEDFPTLAVFRGGATLHFGASLPQEGVVARLLDALTAAGDAKAADSSVAGLPERLQRHLQQALGTDR